MLEPYITTYSGGRVYPLGPRASDINITDIAHALSQICRYNGHTTEFWSVAAHSLEVSTILEEMGESKMVQYIGLLHDACEFCLCDIPRPVKPLVLGYSQWEETVDYVVARKFGLQWPWPPVVKVVDHGIVRDEIRNFYPEGSDAWKRYGITVDTPHRKMEPLMPKFAEQKFRARFAQLCQDTNGRHGDATA